MTKWYVFDHATLVTASKSQADGDDIRFLSSDNATEYVYSLYGNLTNWGWDQAQTTACVMVKEWTSSTNLVMHMYYDNDAATNGQSGIENAFDTPFTTTVLSYMSSNEAMVA